MLVADQYGHFFYEDDLRFTDPNFFKVFNFPFSQGDPKTALSELHSVVITEAVAQKYFGEQSPMGQTLIFNDQAFKVTGVLKTRLTTLISNSTSLHLLYPINQIFGLIMSFIPICCFNKMILLENWKRNCPTLLRDMQVKSTRLKLSNQVLPATLN